MKYFPLFCIILTITTPALAFDTWIFKKSNAPAFKSWGHNVVKAPHPIRYGKTSEKFEVRPGDCGWNIGGTWNDCENNRERHELTTWDTGTHIAESGDNLWYRFSIYLPKSNADIRGIDISYIQLFGGGSSNSCRYHPYLQIVHSYPLGIWVKGIGYEKYGSTIIPEKGVKGKWHDIIINVLWTPHQFGYIQVFVNGEIKQTHFGPTLSFDCQAAYFKYGIYRYNLPDNNQPKTVAYFDGLRRARSEDKMFDPLDE